MSRKGIIFAFSMMFILVLLGGCGQEELTINDIKATEFYQELETKYSQLERKYEQLKKQTTVKEEVVAEDAKAYFKSMKRSTFIKVRYSDISNGKYEISDNLSLCKWLKGQLARAIVESNQNAEEWRNEQTPLYQYTLYNEDNSICQCQVYEGNYVIFDSLPDTVYYVAQVLRIGDGSFGRTDKAGIPKRSLITRLYESQLLFEDGEIKTTSDCEKLIMGFEQCKGKVAGSKPLNVEANSIREYIFKCDGDTYVMEVYKSCYSVTENGGSVTWYQSEGEKVQQFLKVLD